MSGCGSRLQTAARRVVDSHDTYGVHYPKITLFVLLAVIVTVFAATVSHYVHNVDHLTRLERFDHTPWSSTDGPEPEHRHWIPPHHEDGDHRDHDHPRPLSPTRFRVESNRSDTDAVLGIRHFIDVDMMLHDHRECDFLADILFHQDNRPVPDPTLMRVDLHPSTYFYFVFVDQPPHQPVCQHMWRWQSDMPGMSIGMDVQAAGIWNQSPGCPSFNTSNQTTTQWQHVSASAGWPMDLCTVKGANGAPGFEFKESSYRGPGSDWDQYCWAGDDIAALVPATLRDEFRDECVRRYMEHTFLAPIDQKISGINGLALVFSLLAFFYLLALSLLRLLQAYGDHKNGVLPTTAQEADVAGGGGTLKASLLANDSVAQQQI